jgi:hypothetical protein
MADLDAEIRAHVGRLCRAPDSTRQDEGGWVCWLDLDYVGRMLDDATGTEVG